MEQPTWDVLRCPDCSQTYGRKRGTAPRCSRCGRTGEDGVIIVAQAENVHDLRDAIAMANVPKEIRQELQGKLPKERMTLPIAGEEKAPQQSLAAIASATDDFGVITIERLELALRKKGISAQPIQIVEWAESEGLLLRLDEGRWQTLE
ncbi:MAG: hypothetical protein QF817_02255 [Candidatus Poseidoniaceae archaeon]|nr:hypothetical protein [Candidatus Poseidoniaceae archaeon]